MLTLARRNASACRHAKYLKAISYAKVKTDKVDSQTLAILLRQGLIPRAHKLARIVFAMLKEHSEYRDLGELYYEQHFKERTINRLKRKASDLGFLLVPLDAPSTP